MTTHIDAAKDAGLRERTEKNAAVGNKSEDAAVIATPKKADAAADIECLVAPTSPTRLPPAFAKKPFIALAGMIGAGKTTLSTQLSKRLGLPLFEEPVASNTILADFYKDMAKHGFHLQIHLLNIRFQQHQKVVWNDEGGVSDRSIYEDCIFAKLLMKSGMMSAKEYNTYMSLFQNMSKFLKQPTVIVYLDVTPEKSVERIRRRARDMEKGISLEYLQGLYAGYDEFIHEISKSVPVIRVPWDEFQDVDVIVDKLVSAMERINNIITV